MKTCTIQENNPSKMKDPCIMVIFGATGDLTARKLFPALYNLSIDEQLPANFACIGFARREKSNETFRSEMQTAVNQFSRNKPVDEKIWDEFSERIFYHQSEFHEDEGYERLAKLLDDLDKQYGTKGNRVFYLSTQPSFFPLIIEKLSKHKLIYNKSIVQDKWSRVIIEKPFGHDLDSAIALQNEITKYLNESQIYRIDHYLGKETVQNLLVFRLSNSIFEALWNNHHIDNVQLTVAEEIGIGTRGAFFEEAGILRDIVQNHMMQLLSLLCMEPPNSSLAEAVHNEKVKVVESIRPIPANEIDKYVVRGQYGKGKVDGKEALGYREENNVAKDSTVETFVALELFIDNWRWSGVPFYLRAGKRLPKRTTEIVITFKEPPLFLYKKENEQVEQNQMVIRIQPDEGISLKFNCKSPGNNAPIQPVKMDFRYGSYFGATAPEAYERLIIDCILGDKTLFARVDEVLASWRLLTPVLKHWEANKDIKLPNYECGSWGPADATELLSRDGRSWRLS